MKLVAYLIFCILCVLLTGFLTPTGAAVLWVVVTGLVIVGCIFDGIASFIKSFKEGYDGK